MTGHARIHANCVPYERIHIFDRISYGLRDRERISFFLVQSRPSVRDAWGNRGISRTMRGSDLVNHWICTRDDKISAISRKLYETEGKYEDFSYSASDLQEICIKTSLLAPYMRYYHFLLLSHTLYEMGLISENISYKSGGSACLSTVLYEICFIFLRISYRRG